MTHSNSVGKNLEIAKLWLEAQDSTTKAIVQTLCEEAKEIGRAEVRLSVELEKSLWY
jgi:hypothetical protein